MTLLFFFRYFFSARSGSLIKRIAWLSFIGIIFGLFAFVLILGIMQGLNHNLHQRILAVDPHVRVLVNADEAENHPVIAEIERHEHWRYQPFEEQEVILRSVDGLFRGAIARGISDESFREMLIEIQNLSIYSNTGGPSSVEPPEGDKIVLGVDLARALGSFEGDSLMVLPPEGLLIPMGEIPKFFKVTVSQILSTNLPDVDSGVLFYQKGQALGQLASKGLKKVGFEVWGEDPYDADQIKKILSEVPGVQLETWQERNSALFSALKMEKLIIGLFLGIAALITAFSVVSVMILLISQKRREIGLLRAIGYSKDGIQKLFLKLGFMLSGSAVLIGAFTGALATLYLQVKPLKILPDLYYDSEISAELNLIFIGVTTFIALAVTFSSVYIVLKKAFENNPSELLRNQ